MRKLIVAVLVTLAVTGCTKPTTTKQVLAKAGYTQIVITGYALLSCGQGDVFSTGFTAKGPTGETVTGAVCSGWLKGNTIRLD